MRIIGWMCALLCLGAAMSMSGGLTIYINLPSALIVLVVGFGTLTFAHGGKNLVLLLRALFSQVEEKDAQRVALVAQSAHKSFLYAGGLGSLVGVVAMLANLDDPSAIGPAVAVALLTLLYGAFAAVFLWMPTERRMRAMGEEREAM